MVDFIPGAFYNGQGMTGAPATEAFARGIGADGYGSNAAGAVIPAKRMMGGSL